METNVGAASRAMDTSSELPDVGDILYRLAGWPGQTFWNRMEHERLFGDFGFLRSNDATIVSKEFQRQLKGYR